jgi:pectate lyase
MRRKSGVFIFLLIAGVLWGKNATGAVYQAETGMFYHAVIETKNGGYQGDAYINFDNEPGSYLEITVGMAIAGNQEIGIRYANGTQSARPMEVSLNSRILESSSVFEPTGSWTSWDTLVISADFPQGISTLRFTSTGSEGGPNLDQFDISGPQLPVYTLTLTVVGEGEIIQYPSRGLLFEGEEITLVARPGWASQWKEWTGDVPGSGDTLRFVLDGNKTIHAVFEPLEVVTPEPDFSLTGYAAVPANGLETTTGGKGGELRVIETLSELIAWGASRENNNTPQTVLIRGKIEAEKTTVISIKRGGNISILGDSGAGNEYAELKNISLNIRDYTNVIIQNLKMHEVFYPDDDVTIDHCSHVWIDHCEFYSRIGPGIGVDTYDGLLDIKKGSHHVTVSWCFFHHHMKTMLIGHSDNNGEQDAGLQLTLHHNRFAYTNGRNPSLRFGMCHYYNNYLEEIDDYGFAVRNGAHAKIENCHFESVKTPIATDKFKGHGYACVSGCIYTGSCNENSNQVSEPTDCGFWEDALPYAYELEEVHTVRLSVSQYAGVGKIETITHAVDPKRAEEEFRMLHIFRNTNGSNLEVTCLSQKQQKTRFSLYSLRGIKQGIGSYPVQAGIHTVVLPLPALTSGVYIVLAETPSGSYTKKIWIH